MGDFMFHPDLLWTNYTFSAGLTLLFSLVVMLIMHQKLKAVARIQSLKAVE